MSSLCAIQSCEEPGYISVEGKVALPGRTELIPVQVWLCESHSIRTFGDLTGLFSMGPVEMQVKEPHG